MGGPFHDLNLKTEILKAIDALGFEEPTPIQKQTIPLLTSGADIVAQAPTGTGKTAAFAIPIMEMIDPAQRVVQALVLAPTRELALQVADSAHALGRYCGVNVLPIYGGQAYDHQLRGLRAGAQLVVGTPGRVMDHIRRDTLHLDTVRMVVLDEADEMLDMGFKEDIEFILDRTPKERQMALFSATMPARIAALAKRYMRDPQFIVPAHETRTVPQTHQVYYEIPGRTKRDALTRILDLQSPHSAIIFCRTRRDADELSAALQARGYEADAIHGDMSQAQRERVLKAFRENRVSLLVATDVAARGLDIPDVTHVINYDIPDDSDAYVHRIGRTGRMGRKGEAITLVTAREMRLLHTIEKDIRKKLKPMRLPTPEDVAARRREAFVESLRESIRGGAGERYGLVVEELADEFTSMEIAAGAIALAFEAGPGPGRPVLVPSDGRPTESGMTRMVLDAGRKRGVGPGDIIKALAMASGIVGSDVGNIDVQEDLAFIEIKDAAAGAVLEHAPVLKLRGIDTKLSLVRTSAFDSSAPRSEATSSPPSAARKPARPPMRQPARPPARTYDKRRPR
jgi:ATP-dependent RNA helicase DeaD